MNICLTPYNKSWLNIINHYQPSLTIANMY